MRRVRELSTKRLPDEICRRRRKREESNDLKNSITGADSPVEGDDRTRGRRQICQTLREKPDINPRGWWGGGSSRDGTLFKATKKEVLGAQNRAI